MNYSFDQLDSIGSAILGCELVKKLEAKKGEAIHFQETTKCSSEEVEIVTEEFNQCSRIVRQTMLSQIRNSDSTGK